MAIGRSTSLANIEAMPASLRCALFQLLLLRPSPAHAGPRPQSIRCLATASTSSGPKAQKRSPTAAPQPPPPPQSSLSYIPPPSNIPNGGPAARALQPSASSLSFASALFLRPPPLFLYSAPRFLNVPINTRVPEICVLGRSNVGKSTLINAIAGVASSRAGRSHGPASTRAGIAITSATAGSTRTMNAYGFGPPMSIPPRAKALAADDDAAAADAEAESEDVEGDGDKTTSSSSGGGGSGTTTRSQRRSRTIIREAPPRHSLVLMDMPGYGLNSRSEWGVEVSKYLNRRAMLRGAVVLIDAVTGVKNEDRAVLGLLRDSGVRTLVVLTKADKVVGYRHSGETEDFVDVAAVTSRCAEVWTELRELETKSLAWTEGLGWEKEVWVTGAGDPKNGSLGVAGVRFAIAKMAGLLEDKREDDRRRKAVAAGPSRIVPFDEIQWAPQERQPDPNRPSF